MPEDNPNTSSSDAIVVRGGCRCGNITYTSTTLPSSITNCHCNACRKTSGSPYLTLAAFPTSSLSWASHTTHGSTIGNTSDESGVSTYEANPWAQRGFCANCGSTIRLHDATQLEEMNIAVGSIDEGSVIGELPKPKRHIFLEEKAGWFDLPEDGLERFQRFSEEGYDEKVEAWMKEHGKQGRKRS